MELLSVEPQIDMEEELSVEMHTDMHAIVHWTIACRFQLEAWWCLSDICVHHYLEESNVQVQRFEGGCGCMSAQLYMLIFK